MLKTITYIITCIIVVTAACKQPNPKVEIIQTISADKLDSIEMIQQNITPKRIKLADSIYINYGHQFSMCAGYCYTEYHINSLIISMNRSGYDSINYTPSFKIKRIDPTKWKALLQNLNIELFRTLPDKIGCPGCDDGGVEWIELNYHGEIKRIDIEYHSSLPNSNKLLEILRSLRVI